MSAISGSARWVAQGVDPSRAANGSFADESRSTRRLPPALPPVSPPLPAERTRSGTRRLPPPPLPQRPQPAARREEESDLPLLDFAPGTRAGELARFAPPPTPSRGEAAVAPPESRASEPAPSGPTSSESSPTRRARRSEPGWRVVSAVACRVCGSSLEAATCKRCGETAPRPGESPSSASSPPLPDHPPASRRTMPLIGALACAAIGLPVTLFLEGEARHLALGVDLVLGALAGPFVSRGAGLVAFSLVGASGATSKVALGTLLGSLALSWDALQTDPLLLGLLGATLFATAILGGLLTLVLGPDPDLSDSAPA